MQHIIDGPNMVRATKCETCGHSYINPCGSKRRAGCENVRIVTDEPKPHSRVAQVRSRKANVAKRKAKT